MAERQFGPYKLIRQIAVGGMAEIHLAKTAGIAGFEKYVALKMIHPNFAEDDQFIQMLVDEAKIAVQLTHGNIAQTFDLGRVGETYYITMEYVDGADLYKILRRASEQDLEMPLDVCAFLGKEVASALDHAHRKRDHAGNALGIVHRDVSPQNVLVSYSGEVKLVDFGIAKATMKVRQTAVGVIKGKYYYMSPEQAWGDPIDHRSDIFSAGIVLYEMITGQMLYLEEDLQKLLEMARRAEIAPPSKLRRGVPPQLERIVMHALAKVPGERYQSAGDLATDLERFLHAYSPVFTASKLSALVRQVIGDPIQVPDDPGEVSVEFRGGVMSTHPLDDSELAHAIDRDELRDKNSVIFRVSDLEKPRPPEPSPAARTSQPSTPPPRPGASSAPPPRPGASSAPPFAPSAARPPRPGASAAPPARPGASSPPLAAALPSLPSVPRVTRAAAAVSSEPRASLPRLPSIVAPRPAATLPSITKPRQIHEETRQLDSPAPPDPLHDDSSGLLTTDGKKLSWEDADRIDTADEDLDHIAERTVITAAPGMPGAAMSGFMMDDGGDDGDGQIEATLITAAPTGPGFPADPGLAPRPPSESDDDGPTVSRDFEADHPTKPQRLTVKPPAKAPPPPALAAKIHAPAVSELRKPRASRKTPAGGVPAAGASVLHAIVASRPSEPMPAPRPSAAPPSSASHAASHATMAMPPHEPAPAGVGQGAFAPPVAMMPPNPYAPADAAAHLQPGLPTPYTGPFPVGTAGGHAYHHDASGLPLGIPTPPGTPVAGAGMPYPAMQGMHPEYGAPHLAAQMSPQGYPQMSPNALYQFQPTAQPMSITGQMRLLEIDEIPSQYKLGSARRRWLTYVLSGLLAVSVAAAVTFLIIRSTREATPTTGSVHLESVPAGATVTFDGTELTDRTPLTIDGAMVGTRHEIRIALPHYKPFTDIIDIPKNGRTISVLAQLASLTGKLLVNTTPSGAEIRINGQVRGVTPTKLDGLDIDATKTIELRHKDFPPHEVTLKWDADGLAYVEYRFAR